MKKTSLLFAIASIALIALPSCKKTDQEKLPVTETINTTVNVNETYSYVLPTNEGPEPFVVVKQTEHASNSVIEKNADGNFVYKYTPTSNFTGTDIVIISNEKNERGPSEHHEHNCDHSDRHRNKKGHHGNCDHNGMQKHIIAINFTIAPEKVTTESTKASDK